MEGETCPSGWRLVKLGELGEVNRGRSRHRPRYAPHLYGGSYPFIQTGDIRASGGRITRHSQTYSAAGLAQSRLWPAGTLCITIAANIAETAILTYPACFPDSVVGFVPNPSLCDVRFIEYMFRFLRQEIQFQATGSVQYNINLATLERLTFPLPPLEEQVNIASLLGAFDDKIELNRRINQTLEAMARAIFKSWFVDFEPVLNGHPLFPTSLVESQLGLAPQGWRVGELGTFVTVVDCLHSKKPERLAEGKALLQLANIRNDGLLDMSDTYLISEDDYKEWTSRMEAQPGDCVITNVGRVGAVAQVPRGHRAALGRNMTGLRCKAEFPGPTFLIECLRSSRMKEEIERKTDSGTILDSLNVRSIPRLRLVLPSRPVLEDFETICRPLRAKMEQNQKENSTLTTLRDTLLPKLLSGEIRVKQAEKLVGEVV